MNERERDQWVSDMWAARAQGKTLQVVESGKWRDAIDGPGGYGNIDHWRIKPEPREWWTLNCRGIIKKMFSEKKNALEFWGEESDLIKVREVVE